jgi:hypothetical protein
MALVGFRLSYDAATVRISHGKIVFCMCEQAAREAYTHSRSLVVGRRQALAIAEQDGESRGVVPSENQVIVQSVTFFPGRAETHGRVANSAGYPSAVFST